jgi:hypothetical protein
MKFRYTLPFIICFFIAPIYGQYIPSYVESSTGLDNPALDGGRTEIELADINNDGNLDILSIGDHGSPYINTQEHGIMVWFGDGNGNWTVSQNGNFGYGGIAVGDVNNDGMLDVGYAMHHNYSSTDFGDQLIEVALGDGTGLNWTPWDDGLATNGESWGMFGTDFADIDGDGDLDVGSNSFGASSGIHIYLNNGDGTWTQSFGFTGGNSTDDFVFGDVNNDGYPDFAAAQQYGTVYINDSTGNFIQSDGNLPPAGNLGRYGPDLGDVDNDGTDELSFANSNGGVEVWKWSEGNQWSSISGSLPASGTYDGTQLYDMNSDGFTDLIAFSDGLVRIWLGDGNGSWTQAADITVPNQGTFVALRVEGDADHNGYADVALVDEEGSFVTYQNHLRFFKEASPADNLTIRSIYPSANRHINIGSVMTIKWLSEVPAGNTSVVKMEISKSDTSGPWIMISDQLKNNGQYQWIVPDSLASSEPCRIKFTVYSGSDSVSNYSPQFFISPESVVPVELVSFNATAQGNNVSLSWQTATETNNRGFEVQRSDRKDYGEVRGQKAEWKKIDFLEGNGTTNESHSYSYTDKDVTPGRYYYRLKQIDFNGSYSFSKEIEADVSAPMEFSLEQNYPNPFNPVTTIEYKIPDVGTSPANSAGRFMKFVKLKVYNTLGEEVTTLVNEEKPAGNYSVKFNGSNLPSGVYFYKLAAGSFIATRKMVLLR